MTRVNSENGTRRALAQARSEGDLHRARIVTDAVRQSFVSAPEQNEQEGLVKPEREYFSSPSRFNCSCPTCNTEGANANETEARPQFNDGMAGRQAPTSALSVPTPSAQHVMRIALERGFSRSKSFDYGYGQPASATITRPPEAARWLGALERRLSSESD
ncbi:hypothetical protein HK405_008285, partial [Cladochytrium tenue]